MKKINILNIRNKHEWEHVLDIRTMVINDPRIDARYAIYRKKDNTYVVHSEAYNRTFVMNDKDTTLQEIKK